ncbi:MAG: hypothetical protein AUI14_18650 [Actinobacteria bacterium 13_2_20CM_2_71_6]|nr:MAG: hypothetical protein AUI14_18650 [Actinobacteria bacterium 13_2_20CM_2_71_6]
MRRHTSHSYLLPQEGIVVRIAEATDENLKRAAVAAAVTTWLSNRGFPCVRPVQDVPIEVADMVATAWRYLPQPEPGGPLPMTVLGTLLRDLHQLPEPAFPLPAVDPLARLRRALSIDAGRQNGILATAERRFIEDRIAELTGSYVALDFPLGIGLIHNDAHIGNLLADPESRSGFVLGDWDGAALGPREIDLIQEGAPGNRFGLPDGYRRTFSAAYGYDVATWPGWRVLRDMRDLHSIGAYLRIAPDKPVAQAQLRLRLRTLRTGDTHTRWAAVT